MISNRLRIGCMALFMTPILSEASQDQQIQQPQLIPCSCPECQKLVQDLQGSEEEKEFARQQQLNHAAVQEVMKFKEETNRPLKALYEQKMAQKQQLEDENRTLKQEVQKMRQQAIRFGAIDVRRSTEQDSVPQRPALSQQKMAKELGRLHTEWQTEMTGLWAANWTSSVANDKDIAKLTQKNYDLQQEKEMLLDAVRKQRDNTNSQHIEPLEKFLDEYDK